MSYVPESNIRMKTYDHSNFSRASVVQFWASRYIIFPNRTSVWNVMTIWISRELPMFIFERLYMWCTLIGHPFEKLWPFKFLDSFRCSISSASIYYKTESDLNVKGYDHLNFSRDFVVQFRASRYMMRLNRKFEWKVMSIWISRELQSLNFERLHMWCA